MLRDRAELISIVFEVVDPNIYIYSTKSCYQLGQCLFLSSLLPSYFLHFKHLKIYLPLNAQTSVISNMTVKVSSPSEEQSNPWVQTPLRESYALSEAAGWYGHTSLAP